MSKKRKSQSGSTVSSTQRSDGEEDASDDSGDEFSQAKNKQSRLKSFKKPGSAPRKTDDDDDDVSDDDEDAENTPLDKRSLLKASKKRANGHEKSKKTVSHTNSVPRKPGGKQPHSKEKRLKSGKSGKSSLDDDDDEDDEDNNAVYYDTEECSARPCKQPQDVAIDWIQCDKCTLWYHQVCVGLKPSDADVDTYYCPYCKKS